MDLEFVEDEEETFSISVVKEESYDQYDQFDNKAIVLSHVENDFSER